MPSNHYTSKRVRGSIIAFSLLVLSILLSSGLAVVSVAVLEKKSGLATQKSVIALQAADSGVERILDQIYNDNSPSTMTVPLNNEMPVDRDLTSLASHLANTTTSRICNTSTNRVSGRNDANPAYTFEATFFDETSAVIQCNDRRWRDKLIRLRVEGFFRNTSRVLELGIKQRPECDASNSVTDSNGNTYQTIKIGDQCWLDRNMNVGNMIPSAQPQVNDSIIQKYCYNNQANNCTQDHPNKPDGGLYTWNEAMGYVITERTRGICPDGWHIPTDSEWYQLENYLKGAGQVCSSGRTGTECAPAGTGLMAGGTSNFEANLTGGWYSGVFDFRNQSTVFWTSTQSDATRAWGRELNVGTSGIGRGEPQKIIAFPVRCIKG